MRASRTFGSRAIRNCRDNPQSAIRNPQSSAAAVWKRSKPRRLMAGDVAPQVLLGSVYFEEATGDDSAADIIEVSFVGGAPGTTLNRLTINGDKQQNGLTEGDVFFDTAAGGLGAFDHGGLSIVSANGFTVNSVTVVDGGSQIVFNLSGFDAGEKLVLLGRCRRSAVRQRQRRRRQFARGRRRVSALDHRRRVLGHRLRRSHADRHILGRVRRRVRRRASGNRPDARRCRTTRYSPTHDYTDRTAGAVAHARADSARHALRLGLSRPQRRRRVQPRRGAGHRRRDARAARRQRQPHRHHDDHVDQSGDARLLRIPQSVPRHVRRARSAADRLARRQGHGRQPRRRGGQRIGRPRGPHLRRDSQLRRSRAWSTTSASCCPARSAAACMPTSTKTAISTSRRFCSKACGSICSMRNGNFIRFTLTNANGEYEFTGLAPGIYQVREHQPTQYYDGGERIGSAGGAKHDVPGVYSIFTGINITSDRRRDSVRLLREGRRDALGQRLPRSRQRRHLRSRPGEEGIGGVVLKLLDGSGNDTGLRATTDSAGFYKFTNLAAGTYTVVEVHPAGWLDGKDTPGNLGGVADVSPPGDLISQIMINWGQTGIEYNFGELLPVRSAAASTPTTAPTATSTIRTSCSKACGSTCSTPAATSSPRRTPTPHGEYAFTGLRPGTYSVREHQPAEYFDGGERIGTAGGAKHDVAGVYSIFTGINIGSRLQRGPVRLLREAARLDQRPRARRRARGLQLRRSGNSARRRASSSCSTPTATSSPRRPPTPHGEYRFDGLRTGRVPGPRDPADRLLRRRRARRLGGRRARRHRHDSQHRSRRPATTRSSTTSARRSA